MYLFSKETCTNRLATRVRRRPSAKNERAFTLRRRETALADANLPISRAKLITQLVNTRVRRIAPTTATTKYIFTLRRARYLPCNERARLNTGNLCLLASKDKARKAKAISAVLSAV